MVGEWSNAITDCARWLNGRNVGARWDNTYSSNGRYHGSCDGYTGSYANFSDEYKQILRRYASLLTQSCWLSNSSSVCCIFRYFEVQIEIGERVQGWVFWTWKVRVSASRDHTRGLQHILFARLKKQMSGVINVVWREDGFLAIQVIVCTRIYARRCPLGCDPIDIGTCFRRYAFLAFQLLRRLPDV